MSRPSYNGPGDRLKPYAYVETEVVSGQSTLPDAMSKFVAGLQASGWTVGPYSVETEIDYDPRVGPRKISVYLHRTDRKYTEAEAASAVDMALRSVSLPTSKAIAAYAGEVYDNVVKPAINALGDAAKRAADSASAVWGSKPTPAPPPPPAKPFPWALVTIGAITVVGASIIMKWAD